MVPSCLPVPREEKEMKKLLFALTALSLVAGSAPALAKPCKDKHGRFMKCPKKCRDSKGHFISCPARHK